MIRFIAVDDEPLAVKQLEDYISRIPFLKLEGSFINAVKACMFIQEHEVDLLFTDINMPDMNGLDLARSLNKDIKVIFTTAYSEHAYEGFRLDAADYILKPFGFSDFLNSVNKVKERYFSHEEPIMNIIPARDYLFIRSEYKTVRINFNDIRYVESCRDYVKIYAGPDEPVQAQLTLKKIEEALPANLFMRVHRSFIVNLSKINVIENNRIVFDSKTYIPIGDLYMDDFQKYINAVLLKS